MELQDLKEIKFINVLLEYGVEPLVAICEDADGMKYLASAILDNKYKDPYLVVQLSEAMATKVVHGSADVLSAILTPIEPKWYVLDLVDSSNGGTLQLLTEIATEIPINYLPGPELYL